MPAKLRAAITSKAPLADITALANKLHAQRFGPVEKHLGERADQRGGRPHPPNASAPSKNTSAASNNCSSRRVTRWPASLSMSSPTVMPLDTSRPARSSPASATNRNLTWWEVDDAATMLLMTRFDENLLGKRTGLTAPMTKAAALNEAKAWLRNLSRDEATRLTAELTDSYARGKGEKPRPAVPTPVVPPDDRPFAHPHYWAGFVLIGDPF